MNCLTGAPEPAVVCIGGGTGLSTMLRGLKQYTRNITAIVTVADDGGGSGMLRDDLGMLPPGDIRNCILSLADMEPTMEKLLAYRFPSGSLEGQSFGNLFLAAMDGISDSFDQAVSRMCEVLAITGRVLPVSNENMRLAACFADGSEVVGESHICRAKKAADCRISRVRLIPDHPKALPESLQAIAHADLLLLGPGSLYTSLIPNLLVEGVSDAICRSRAVKIYVANIMSQDGETEGYTLDEHIRELFRHGGMRPLFDVCIANSSALPADLIRRYGEEGAEQLTADPGQIAALGVRLYTGNLAGIGSGFIRHDPQKLAEMIFRVYEKEMRKREER